MLVDLLNEFGIGSSCLNMYREKCKQPNFNLVGATQQQHNSGLLRFSELFYDSKQVLPMHRWLPGVPQAFADYEAQASSIK